MTAWLELAQVSFAVGRTQILRAVDLAVEKGECLALLGPSGCGKTTTLRAIAGFVVPDAGTVRLGGRIITALRPHRRNIGLVFQDFALFPHMTVRENVAYGLRRRGVARDEAERRVGEMLETVKLDGMAARLPHELSGGQKQRVALARALVIRPDILLLDEPLGALDRLLRDAMQVELKRLQRRFGIATVIVTHDQEEALALSDRVALMFEGRIADVGRPADIYRRPGTRQVMEFLGTANVLSGTVIEASGGAVGVDCGGWIVRARSEEFGAGRKVRVAIRPEYLRLGPGENEIAAEVAEFVYKGTHSELYLRTASGHDLTARWHADRGDDAPPPKGAPLRLSFRAEDVRLFAD
jgi:ABC-type Fe3+/spermidine/putrescine transport system ATPase subunit